MAKHLVVRFFRIGDAPMLVTDEYRTDDVIPHTLGYVDHDNDGATAEVTVQDPYTGLSRHYGPRPKAKALGIMSRHLERTGYKYCLAFQDLTAGTVPGKL